MPDPSLWKLQNDYQRLCSTGEPNKETLQLIDGCFKVINTKGETLAGFCVSKCFSYPVDNYEIKNLTIDPNSSVILFDNQLQGTENALDATKTYARGIIVLIMYPTADLNGLPVDPALKSARIEETDADGAAINAPVGDFFSRFNNPFTINSTKITNRLSVINTEAFPINVKAIVIYTKAENGQQICDVC